MCFGGPTAAEKAAAAEQRADAEEQKRSSIEETAEGKRTDIASALSGKDAADRGFSGGGGRRSLFQSTGGGSGFSSRYDT